MEQPRQIFLSARRGHGAWRATFLRVAALLVLVTALLLATDGVVALLP